jgi:hypothetical protein
MTAVFYHVRPRYRERSPPIAATFQSPQRRTRVVFLHTAFDAPRPGRLHCIDEMFFVRPQSRPQASLSHHCVPSLSLESVRRCKH